jgi:cytochrome c oxidase subunit 2
VAAAGALASCTASPSALDPHGPQGASTATLTWVMVGLAAVVWLAVMGLLVAGLLRRRRGEARPPDAARDAGSGAIALVVACGIVVPVLVLAGLMAVTARTLAAVAAPPTATALTVEVTGHLWWWEVHYREPDVTTANEIHVPAGQPVQLVLRSQDVIHSFWVPQLMGKLDVIPGQTNTTWLQADAPGTYRGQCAEYCGLQHAHMALLVIADAPTDFAAWLEAQRRPATPPADPEAQRGAQAFAQVGCIACHRIRFGAAGAGGTEGPDLTHVGSRETLAAGTLPNTKGYLAGWIGNPQAIKPGTKMPTLQVGGEDLRALAAYLETLK